jgi:trehalose 6-phosphate phosphatase
VTTSEATSKPSRTISEALHRCLAVLAVPPAALLTDIDGTISQIAPTPEEAVVAEPARDALNRMAHRLALVGAVTGRSAAAGASLVNVPGLTYVGNHGLERLVGTTSWRHPVAVAGAEAIRSALVEVGEVATAAGIADGLLFEDKDLSGSIHYRLSQDPEAARAILVRTATSAAEARGLRVTEGRLVIELRPMLAVNKGTAIADLVAEHGLRGVVFFGDDVTDVDAFVRLRALREEAVVAAVTVGVVGAETPLVVTESSDLTVFGVGTCIELMQGIADHLDALEGTEP